MPPPTQSVRDLRAFLVIALLILGGWILYLSLHPFEPVESWSLFWDRLVDGMREMEPERLSMHVLAFALFGTVLGLASASGLRILGFRASLLLPDFCLTIELLQAATTTRHPRLGDLLLDLAVAWVAHWLADRTFSRPDRLERLAQRAVWMARLGVGMLLLLFATAPFFRAVGSSLDNWDPTYRLCIGDEVGGGRPWSGTVQQLAIYPQALSETDAAKLASEASQGHQQALGAALLWDFRTEDPLQALAQRIAGSEVPRLESDAPRAGREGIAIAEGRSLTSATAPAGFVEKAIRSDAFSIEVRLESTSLHQTGPARILTLSKDTFHRNVTLGQVGADLILRVRTPWNGDDGSIFEASWSRALVPEGMHHFLVTYDRGRFRLHRNGEELLPAQDLSGPGIGVAMLDLFDPMAAILLLLIPLGLLLSWLRRSTLAESRRRKEALLGLLLTAWYLVAGYISGSDMDPITLFFLLLGLPLGDLVGTWLVGRLRRTAPLLVLPTIDERHE